MRNTITIFNMNSRSFSTLKLKEVIKTCPICGKPTRFIAGDKNKERVYYRGQYEYVPGASYTNSRSLYICDDCYHKKYHQAKFEFKMQGKDFEVPSVKRLKMIFEHNGYPDMIGVKRDDVFTIKFYADLLYKIHTNYRSKPEELSFTINLSKYVNDVISYETFKNICNKAASRTSYSEKAKLLSNENYVSFLYENIKDIYRIVGLDELSVGI